MLAKVNDKSVEYGESCKVVITTYVVSSCRHVADHCNEVDMDHVV